MKKRFSVIILSSALLAAAGCEPEATTGSCNSSEECPDGEVCRHGECVAAMSDAGGSVDAGSVDSALLDAGGGVDQGSADSSVAADSARPDSAIAPDTARPDSSGGSDTSTGVDTAGAVDATVVVDAAAGVDTSTGMDVTAPVDAAAGVDATAATDAAMPDSTSAPDASGSADAFVPDPTPLSAVELCGIYHTKSSNSSYCLQSNLQGAAEPGAELDLMCRPGSLGHNWALSLRAASRDGRVNIDWAAARECLRRSRELRAAMPAYSLPYDAEWIAMRDGICSDFYQGAVGEGETCEENWDCQVAGQGCYTDDPVQPGGQRCMEPQVEDGPCDEYWVCGAGLYCGTSYVCTAQGGVGDSCTDAYGVYQCLSGICTGGTCAAAITPVALGAVCIEGDTCDGACSSCRPAQAGGALACRVRGTQGQYCRTAADCMSDLGCTGNVCTTVGDGEACGYQTESRCAPGVTCASAVNCSAFNGEEQLCGDQAPSCVYDTDSTSCLVAQGTCVESPPTSGNCLFGYLCAADHYCRAATTTCALRSVESESCDDEGVSSPPCRADLRCIDGACAYACLYREDCASDQYCDTGLGTCQPLAPTSCTSSLQCAADQYCDTSNNTCYSRLMVGALCATGDQCVTGTCWALDSGESRCAERSRSGCYVDQRNPSFLRAAFLLGGVVFTVGLARRRRR